jgi:hypothetical protein
MSYKRSQLEAAITRLFKPDSNEPASELRTRIKRLLELDRNLGRKLRSQDPEEGNFAFFSEEPPGTGADISFSEYEAFALLNALSIMEHGWPQSFAVSIMRRVRPNLTKEHARILRQDPQKLIDTEATRKNPSPGDPVVDNTDPVFLTVVSKGHRAPNETKTVPECAVCRGLEAVNKFCRQMGASGWTMWEVATIAHKLRGELRNTEPRRRGRVSTTTGRGTKAHE